MREHCKLLYWGGACGQNAIEIQENNVQRNTFWSKISTNCRA